MSLGKIPAVGALPDGGAARSNDNRDRFDLAGSVIEGGMSPARCRRHEEPNEGTTAQELAALGAHREDRFHVPAWWLVHERRGDDCTFAGVETREPEGHRLRYSNAAVLHQSRWQRPVANATASARTCEAFDAAKTCCGERRHTSSSAKAACSLTLRNAIELPVRRW